MSDTHPPGSDDARALGCTCPVSDNGRGQGVWTDRDGKRLFWYASDCPYHMPPREAA